MGHSMALTPFDSLHIVSCYRPIVTLCLKCTVIEIWGHIGRKSPKKPRPTPLSFGTFLEGDPLRIFRRVVPCQKVKSWGYQMVYISWSSFRSSRHNTGCDRRTDRYMRIFAWGRPLSGRQIGKTAPADFCSVNRRRRWKIPGYFSATVAVNADYSPSPAFVHYIVLWCQMHCGPPNQNLGGSITCPTLAMFNAQYTPPTPTGRNCFVASASAVWTHPSAVVTHYNFMCLQVTT